MSQQDSQGHRNLDALDSAQLQKLQLEIDELRSNSHWSGQAARYIPLVTVIVTVAGLCFGIYQFSADRREAREAREDELELDNRIRERELFKPLWEKQIELLFRASETVATIATSSDEKRKGQAVEEFWELYQGPLVVVESKGVSGAMVRYGSCLDGSETCDSEELRKRSRALATQVQEALSQSWADGLGGFSDDKFKYH